MRHNLSLEDTLTEQKATSLCFTIPPYFDPTVLSSLLQWVEQYSYFCRFVSECVFERHQDTSLGFTRMHLDADLDHF
jgi:hypothetical protein